jgi:hypothetical protein
LNKTERKLGESHETSAGGWCTHFLNRLLVVQKYAYLAIEVPDMI